MKCTTEDCFNPIENKDTGLCASCSRQLRKGLAFKAPKEVKPIAKHSKKMQAAMALYSLKKKHWIKGKRCSVFTEKPATDIHHMKGRIGELLLDESNWLPVSREGHQKIELNPKWAKEMGFSDFRLIKT